VTQGGPHSERALVLAPTGRDAELAVRVLGERGMRAVAVPDLPAMLPALEAGAGLVVAAEECFHRADLSALAAWFAAQPPWSDLPVLLLTLRGGGPERNPALARVPALLGNVTALERPFHPATLANAAMAALRGRRRQYEARARLEELSRAEAALRAANDALERRVEERTRALEQANAALRAEARERAVAEEALRQSQKMEALGQLTGGLAHDVNNMLQGIGGALEMLGRRVAGGRLEEVPRLVEAGREGVARAAGLTHGLLAFARRQRLDVRSVPVDALMRTMVDLVRRTVGPAIAVELRLADGRWPVRCDPSGLESALLNLAINARDAMPDGGRLVFATGDTHLDEAQEEAPAGDYVVISVADTGSGMSPEVMRHAFEPFFTTKPLGKGTGLGLSQTYGFMRQSGGFVRMESAEGEGTTIRLFLPRAEAEDAPPAAPPVAPPRGAPRAVLLVEDEGAVRRLAAETLREAGNQVLEAAEGRAALALLDGAAEVALLVTDVGLPGLNGRQLADAARERRPGLPVLFITGYAAGALDGPLPEGMATLSKPFRLEELAARVAAMLDVSPAGGSRTAAAGP